MDHALVFDVSCGHSHVDVESSGLEMSPDVELGFLMLLLQVQGKVGML